MKNYRPLPVGIDDFRDIIEKGYYYVDKTLFIRELLDKKGSVNLFMRPRRFGKTLALSMIKYYFEEAFDLKGNPVDYSGLFSGLKIMRTPECYQKMMGRYPVIFLTLKSARQENFSMAYTMIVREIADEFKRHRYITGSAALSEEEKRRYNKICDEQSDMALIYDALKFLSQCLYKVYEKKTIILIDEYDVPLENAYFCLFYDKMTMFVRSLFESALKSNPYLEFSVITGCLRISKESIFTGLNNLNMLSVLNNMYSEYFGFTQKEVDEALLFYNRESHRETVRAWYDGYMFGETEVYNPWSVIKYIQDAAENENCFPVPYWANTSSNRIVKVLVEHADVSAREEIEHLIEGGTIEKAVHEEITYDEVEKNEDSLWNFLFFTGYLKKTAAFMEGRNLKVRLGLPNEEIKYIYENIIIGWFQECMRKEDLSPLYRALEEQNCMLAGKIISGCLFRTISFYDYAENFYHGFMLGVLSQAGEYIVKSNGEAGNGRADIIMRSPSRHGFAIIFELKIAETIDGLKEACEKGLRQIDERGYAKELAEDGYRQIRKYAVAFYKKDCEVMCPEDKEQIFDKDC